MKTCKSFFSKSLIITSVEELERRNLHYYSYRYGVCLLTCSNHDYSAQNIYKFTDNIEEAKFWLSNTSRHSPTDLYGVVLGSEL